MCGFVYQKYGKLKDLQTLLLQLMFSWKKYENWKTKGDPFEYQPFSLKMIDLITDPLKKQFWQADNDASIRQNDRWKDQQKYQRKDQLTDWQTDGLRKALIKPLYNVSLGSKKSHDGMIRATYSLEIAISKNFVKYGKTLQSPAFRTQSQLCSSTT